MNKKEFYTWSEFDRDVIRIAKWAQKQNFKNIYGLPRGGLPLAVSLSHKLGLPLIWDKEKIERRTLVADDIADSGKTLKKLLGLPAATGLTASNAQAGAAQAGKKKVMVATLYLDKQSIFIPEFYCRIKNGWVVFPWETEGSSKYDRTI